MNKKGYNDYGVTIFAAKRHSGYRGWKDPRHNERRDPLRGENKRRVIRTLASE
jgi:hypothetical protein